MRLLLPLALLAPALAGQPTKRPPDEERGRTLYTRHCASCHGAKNHGDGLATAALVHPVPDLAGKVAVDADTVDVVLAGRGPMPGFEGSLDKEEARSVLRFMATAHEVADAPAPAPPAPEPQEPEGDGPG